MLCWFDQYKQYQRLVYEIFFKITLTIKRITIFFNDHQKMLGTYHWFSNKISSSHKNGFVDIFGFVFNATRQQQYYKTIKKNYDLKFL